MDRHLCAILGPDPIPFETLISDLITSSNEQRSQAESLFNLCKNDYSDHLATKLVNLLQHSPRLEARAMSAILLRNLFKQADPNTLSESTRVSVKSSLLNCVVNEQNKPIIKILGNTISKLAADNGWPELITFMFDLVASEDSRLQESALLIFAQYVGNSLVPHITLLHDVFMNCLGNVGSVDVRIAAFSAVINFIQCLKSSSDRYKFQDLLPRMMQCLTEALNDGNEATVQKALILLIGLDGTEPRFFTGQLVEVVGSTLQIAESESLEEGTRHLAIEFVITLAEVRQLATRMMEKKSVLLISRLFAILMRMLSDIEDEAEWNSAENENEDAGESSNYSIGQECLHRLAAALGANTIVPVAYELLHAYLTAPKWQKHLAALVALAQIAKGLSKVTNKDLEQVVTMVLNSFQDPHPRVRWAAINAIGQLYTYFGPYLQDQDHARVLPALASAMDDFQNPRVQLFNNIVLDITKGKSNKYKAQNALFLLISLARKEPSFFRGQLVEVVGSMLQIAESKSLDAEMRHLAIDFVITLMEARQRATRMMEKKSPHLISRLFAILMRMLLDIEDKDAGDSSNYSVGHDYLHRLVIALGRNTIVPVAYEQLHTCLTAKCPKHLATLVALAQMAKGRSKVMIQNLEQVVTMVLNSFQDPHPRVRCAAVNAIGQLSTYLGPYLQDQYHAGVLPALALALDDVHNPQVQALAASAVFTFRATCPTYILTPYLDGILSKLIVLPQTGLNIRVLRLANSLEGSTDVETRARSAILLREMLKEPLSVLTQELVKYILLRCVKKERERIVMKSLCHTIATCFNVFCSESDWPELFDFVRRCGSGRNDLLQEAAMLISAKLEISVIDPLISLEVNLNCLKNAYSADVRIAAFGGAIGYIRCTARVMDLRLVTAMERLLTEGLNEGQEVTTQEALKLLIEWAHQIKHPEKDFSGSKVVLRFVSSAIKSHVEIDYVWCGIDRRDVSCFISTAIEIAETKSLKKETRHLAIDFVITLWEARQHYECCELMMNGLFELLMSDIEKEADSYWVENEDDDGGVSRNCSVLLEFLGRLAFTLNRNSVAWPKLKEYFHAFQWRNLVIAVNIVALARIFKAFSKVTEKNFNQFLTIVDTLYRDSRPHVRLAAFNATGQLSTDLDPDMQLQYNRILLPVLAKATYGDPDPRVRLAAIKAAGQLYTDLDPDSLLQYNCIVLPYLATATYEDPDPRVRLAAIKATGQLYTDLDPELQFRYNDLMLSALAKAIYEAPNPHVRSAAINATGQLSTALDPNLQFQYNSLVLPALVKAIYKAPNPRMRLAAINAIGQLSTTIDPNLQFQYNTLVLPALAKAIYKVLDPRVRSAAINATGQLSAALDPNLEFQYNSFVLPALVKAIYDFQYPQVQAHAASAMINISKKNCQPDTLTPDLLEIVGTLLEFRRREDIASDQTRILAIENLLKQFRGKLQPDTWASIWSSLCHDQQVEFLTILAYRED